MRGDAPSDFGEYLQQNRVPVFKLAVGAMIIGTITVGFAVLSVYYAFHDAWVSAIAAGLCQVIVWATLSVANTAVGT